MERIAMEEAWELEMGKDSLKIPLLTEGGLT